MLEVRDGPDLAEEALGPDNGIRGGQLVLQPYQAVVLELDEGTNGQGGN